MTASRRILVADDEDTIRQSLADVLAEAGYRVVTAADGRQAVDALQEHEIDVALVDVRMPELDGLQVLAHAAEHSPKTQVIIITAFGGVDAAVEAMRMGARDYVTKPFNFDDILMRIERVLNMRRLADENVLLRSELASQYRFEGIVGPSAALKEVLEMVRKLADTRTSILITGESGTGKELIARAIHYGGITAEGRFVALNCAALPETLVESELFGYKRGAFTGPAKDKRGLFEVADNGTIFLDEIATMPLSVQPKLLRAIEGHGFLPVGGTEPVHVNARVLCATNRDLKAEVEAGRFRDDLYYRLNVVELRIPPIRERREDIPPLVEHYLDVFGRELNKPNAEVSPEAMAAMEAYDWPGNVRELKNVIERGLLFADAGVIGLQDLPFATEAGSAPVPVRTDLRSAAKGFERRHIMKVLRRHDFDKAATAEALMIGLSSLYRKIDELDIASELPSGRSERKADAPQ